MKIKLDPVAHRELIANVRDEIAMMRSGAEVHAKAAESLANAWTGRATVAYASEAQAWGTNLSRLIETLERETSTAEAAAHRLVEADKLATAVWSL